MRLSLRVLSALTAVGLALASSVALAEIPAEAPAEAPAEPAEQVAGLPELHVDLTEWSINGRDLVVSANQPVRLLLKNTGRFPHSLTVGGHNEELASERVDPGKSTAWDVTFSAPGIYQIWCPVGNGRHWDQGMTGTLTVVDETADPVLRAPVVLDEYSILPLTSVAVAGQTMRFELSNVGQRPHNITIAGHGDMWPSERVDPGTSATWDVRLDTPGTYEVYCSIGNGVHKANGMVGTLEVLPSGS
ncbi:MAG: cupredoxin domain-containing protein [Chloroflexi bacterium]|nr:cupredoxin domain-containing protein [Chloroflexota bacterium]